MTGREGRKVWGDTDCSYDQVWSGELGNGRGQVLGVWLEATLGLTLALALRAGEMCVCVGGSRGVVGLPPGQGELRPGLLLQLEGAASPSPSPRLCAHSRLAGSCRWSFENMVQKYQSPVRVYKHPFELVMVVSDFDLGLV